jgi:hypothetical protein
MKDAEWEASYHVAQHIGNRLSGHRIIGPYDIAELRERSIALAVIRLGEHGPTATITETVDATIDALIGEQQ